MEILVWYVLEILSYILLAGIAGYFRKGIDDDDYLGMVFLETIVLVSAVMVAVGLFFFPILGLTVMKIDVVHNKTMVYDNGTLVAEVSRESLELPSDTMSWKLVRPFFIVNSIVIAALAPAFVAWVLWRLFKTLKDNFERMFGW